MKTMVNVTLTTFYLRAISSEFPAYTFLKASLSLAVTGGQVLIAFASIRSHGLGFDASLQASSLSISTPAHLNNVRSMSL